MNITDAYILLLFLISSISIIRIIDLKIGFEDRDNRFTWYLHNSLLTLIFFIIFSLTNYSLSNESTTYYDEVYEKSKNKDLINDILSHKEGNDRKGRVYERFSNNNIINSSFSTCSYDIFNSKVY